MKDRLIFGLIGIVIGAVGGFMLANSINRAETAHTSPAAARQSDASGLPPNHPPIGQDGADGQGQSGGAAAIAEVTAAIEKARSEPSNFEAQMTAGDLYYQIQRFDDAARFYEAASKLKPRDAEPLIKMGNSLFDAEKYVEAETWYRRALEIKPDDANVRSDLGLTFFLREPPDYDRAIAEFKRSLANRPDHEMSLQNLALAYNEKGDRESALKIVEKLKKIDPSNPAVARVEGGVRTSP
ncbi:MAG: tetratricopeptide repeat protein [Pyrinomonadaceae bacterium]